MISLQEDLGPGIREYHRPTPAATQGYLTQCKALQPLVEKAAATVAAPVPSSCCDATMDERVRASLGDAARRLVGRRP